MNQLHEKLDIINHLINADGVNEKLNYSFTKLIVLVVESRLNAHFN